VINMTLETAKRIVLEQGEDSNKEARAVVRGGMTICEITDDGRRNYPWIKVLPTRTDAESSIDQALKLYHQKTTPSSKQSVNPVKTSPDVIEEKPTITFNLGPTVSTSSAKSNVKEVHPLWQLIAYLKRKIDEFVKTMDEFVDE